MGLLLLSTIGSAVYGTENDLLIGACAREINILSFGGNRWDDNVEMRRSCSPKAGWAIGTWGEYQTKKRRRNPKEALIPGVRTFFKLIRLNSNSGLWLSLDTGPELAGLSSFNC